MESIECAVIGAGVVGLGIAEALARAGHETLILEQHAAVGTQISARNSEVIHAGIYYPADSLKARLCVLGRDLLYRFCSDHGVRHRRCGKLIAATSAGQIPELRAIAAHAEACGVHDLQFLSRAEARALEPELECAAALLSPSTGIIDAHEYMSALVGLAEQQGATLATRSAVTGLRALGEGIEIRVGGEEAGGNESPALHARWLINAAGLDAPKLAREIEGFPANWVPATYYAKGSYFSSGQRAPFSRLIYPVPEPGGLGVHLTLDQAGQARFGPDVEWTNELDFSVDERRSARFYTAIRRYWPGLKDGALTPAYAGIRPKLSGPGQPNADFRIDGPADHGVQGLVNLFGIESPGLTASLAIAELISGILRRERRG
jgi:L-2-hydroxyglutarate oxidase LhgO